MPIYELWDTESGNLVGDYTGELDALVEVQEGVRDDGPELWASVALARVEPDGTRTPLAQGEALIARAAATFTAVQVIEALAGFDLEAAIATIDDALNALARMTTEVERAIAPVQAAFDILASASGTTLLIAASTNTMIIATPDETLAGLLAARLARAPYPVQLRAVDTVYRLELAAPTTAVSLRHAS
jgi:hypothetical protein